MTGDARVGVGLVLLLRFVAGNTGRPAAIGLLAMRLVTRAAVVVIGNLMEPWQLARVVAGPARRR
jgi:hypothetical protein